MKRFIGILSAAVLIGVIAGPTAAMAGGNGATATPFTASYANGLYGINTNLVCSGTHVVLEKPHNTFYKDDESCLITGDTTGFIAGTYTSTPGSYFGYMPPYGTGFAWASDFSGENGAWATSWTVTIGLNLNGSVNFNIDAYYPA